AAHRADPLRIPPNAATRALERWQQCAEARDWSALEALFVPSLEFEDRRRGLRDSGNRDKLVASIRVAVSYGTRGSRTTLATAGDRLSLDHVRFFDDARSFEVETLQVTEVDAKGRITAALNFDPDDHRAASAEMLERYARS